MLYFASFFLVSMVVFLVLRYSMFLPPIKGLPVLLYHKVAHFVQDSLTISPITLENQLSWLCNNGYTTISLSQLLAFIKNKTPLPQKPVMITFDDGYVNNLELAYPLLRKYSCKAVFFIPTAGIGKTNYWDKVQEPLMTVAQLLSLDPDTVELGLHAHEHIHYGNVQAEVLENDLKNNIAAFRENQIPFVPALAYPYGGRPKDKTAYKTMIKTLMVNSVKIAFRIGNRVNRLPLKNVYEVQRISIQGSDSMWTFTTKLTKGRVKQV
jgi:peptidoglycan/xylan/chitin deacetylase (PgdA/CDA1 family)